MVKYKCERVSYTAQDSLYRFSLLGGIASAYTRVRYLQQLPQIPPLKRGYVRMRQQFNGWLKATHDQTPPQSRGTNVWETFLPSW